MLKYEEILPQRQPLQSEVLLFMLEERYMPQLCRQI